jgi:hypothetical protein
LAHCGLEIEVHEFDYQAVNEVMLSPFGAPGQVVKMVTSGAVGLCCDARILSEYREVLLRRADAVPGGVSGSLQRKTTAGLI